MAKRIRLTDDDILDLFDSSGDEMDVDQSDEDVDFDLERLKTKVILQVFTNYLLLGTKIWTLVV